MKKLTLTILAGTTLLLCSCGQPEPKYVHTKSPELITQRVQHNSKLDTPLNVHYTVQKVQ